MKLSDRLETILDMLGPGNKTLADIGTDHGFTAIEAVRRGFAERAIASDIGNGPITAARQHIEEAGLTEVIDTRVADGLSGLSPGEADAIIISGMGGGLICHILEEGRYKLHTGTRLILSPQSELKEFRTWMLENGMTIVRERCLMDGGKFYNIIEVTQGWDIYQYKSWELPYGRRILFSTEDLEVRDTWVRHEISVMIGIYNNPDLWDGKHDKRLTEISNSLNLAICSLGDFDKNGNQIR